MCVRAQLGTGVIFPHVQMATIVAVPRNATDVAVRVRMVCSYVARGRRGVLHHKIISVHDFFFYFILLIFLDVLILTDFYDFFLSFSVIFIDFFSDIFFL